MHRQFIRVMSLHSVLRLFQQCLQLIVEGDASVLTVLDQATTSQSSSNIHKKKKIVRIEHVIGAVDDPLSWLRAQYDTVIDRATLAGTTDMLYLCTQERDTEAAIIGSAVTEHDTDTLWSSAYSQLLPTNSQWYGGARFDPHTESSAEWQAFQTAYWILPAIELLVKRPHSTGGKRSKSSATTTLDLFPLRVATVGRISGLLASRR